MRFNPKHLDSEARGGVFITPETVEDLWHVYCIIQVGDHMTAAAYRKVVREASSGATSSERQWTRLTLSVVEVLPFDPEATTLRVAGRNIKENPFVKLGAHHTFELEINREFELSKDRWEPHELERLETAVRAGSENAEIAAVMMDSGLANLCLIGTALTLIKAKIEMNVPKKRSGAGGAAPSTGAAVLGTRDHEKGMNRFFEAVLQAILRHIDFKLVKACIIASPGFVKDDFFAYMLAEATRRDLRLILENKARFVLAHAPGGHKRDLQAVLSDPSVASRLADTAAAGDAGALDRFFALLATDPDRAYYGYKHVRAAADRAAISQLLVADQLLRARQPEVRKAYAALVADVSRSGGTVRTFSSMHASGEQLAQITGVAATLRFPIADIEEAADAVVAAMGGPVGGEPATARADDGSNKKSRGRGGDASQAAAGSYDGPASDGMGGQDYILPGAKRPGARDGAYSGAGYDSDASSDSDASYKQKPTNKVTAGTDATAVAAAAAPG